MPSLVLEDGTVTVDTGCNRGTGSYELGDGEITFGPLATHAGPPALILPPRRPSGSCWPR